MVLVVGASVVAVDVDMDVASVGVEAVSCSAAVVDGASVLSAATVVVASDSGAGPAACAPADSCVSAKPDGADCGDTTSGPAHPTRTTTATVKQLSPRVATTPCLSLTGHGLSLTRTDS